MTSFKNFILENKKSLVQSYHGGVTHIKNLNKDYSRMYHNNGNFQEGVGIYFTDTLDTAEYYGDKISETIVDTSKLLPSREIIINVVKRQKLINFVQELLKTESELWYLFTDYRIEIQEPEDITIYHIEEFVDSISNSEVRNFQLEILASFRDNESFVKAWLKTIKSYGTYSDQNGVMFYALMYNKDKVVKRK